MATRAIFLAAVLLLALAPPALGARHRVTRKRKATAFSGNIIFYNLTITYGNVAPDCVPRQGYLINGQFPGPTITANEGDKLVITVFNALSMEGLSIHWHGIRQLGFNLHDGVAFVTQCPIQPMDFWVYTLFLDKAGTFMYHGHLDSQITAGLYGNIIVNDVPWNPPTFPAYDGELILQLDDWYHRSIYEQVIGLDSKPFGWVGESQSLLINGRGKYNCSLLPPALTDPVVGDTKTCDTTNPACARTVLTVESGKTYRIRISCITSLQSINVAIENHTMTVVAADSYEVQPFVIGQEGLDLYTGQTVDVLLTADQPSGNFWIRTGVIARNPKTPFGLAILQYADSTMIGDPTTSPPAIRAWNDLPFALAQAQMYRGQYYGQYGPPVPSVPTANTARVTLVGAQQYVDGYIKWAVNEYSLSLPSVPYALGISLKQFQFYQPKPPLKVADPWNYSLPAPRPAQYGSGFYTFNYNAVVDLIVQNTKNIAPGSTSEYHPWHMHGHQFWVLGYGDGAWNPNKSPKTYNLVDPPFRNTVTVMPYGWVAIRFIADNPGAWLFHCHIAFHMHMGMGIVFVNQQIAAYPKDYPKCGIHPPPSPVPYR